MIGCFVVEWPDEKVNENVSVAATTIPEQLLLARAPPQPAHFFMRFVYSFNQNLVGVVLSGEPEMPSGIPEVLSGFPEMLSGVPEVHGLPEMLEVPS